MITNIILLVIYCVWIVYAIVLFFNSFYRIRVIEDMKIPISKRRYWVHFVLASILILLWLIAPVFVQLYLRQ